MPEVIPPTVNPCDCHFDTGDTAVTIPQMAVLVWALRETEALGGSVVEVGAYRGVTTEVLGRRTNRTYYAVDPYIGYGGADADKAMMLRRIAELKHVQHIAATSGEAAKQLAGCAVSFAFVDAVHDYVNARFDATVWGRALCAKGMIAFHDVDSRGFPGVQRVIRHLFDDPDFNLVAHVDGVAVFQKRVVQRAAE